VRRLHDAPWEFDFFQAVRILRWLRPHDVPVGRDGPPWREVASFRAHQSLAFPVSAIVRVEWTDPARPPWVMENFLGLTGPSGVLPLHYTETILAHHDWRERTEGFPLPPDETTGEPTLAPALLDRQSAIRDFFDLFNHRFVSFFYRAWEKYRIVPQFELRRFRDRREPDPYTRALLSVIGLGLPALRNRLAVQMPADVRRPAARRAGIDDLSLIHFSGLISNHKPNAASLAVLLRAYFGVEAEVIPFVGQWLTIEEAQQTRIGDPGQNNILGGPASIGVRAYDIQSKFRVRLGPLDFERFQSFLPEPPAGAPPMGLALVFRLVRFYAGEELDCDVELVLRAADVPPTRLAGGGEPGSRLGWNSWIIGEPARSDAIDAAFASSKAYSPFAQPPGNSD
jgi:type VI secretion system protein ImpH